MTARQNIRVYKYTKNVQITYAYVRNKIRQGMCIKSIQRLWSWIGTDHWVDIEWTLSELNIISRSNKLKPVFYYSKLPCSRVWYDTISECLPLSFFMWSWGVWRDISNRKKQAKNPHSLHTYILSKNIYGIHILYKFG